MVNAVKKEFFVHDIFDLADALSYLCGKAEDIRIFRDAEFAGRWEHDDAYFTTEGGVSGLYEIARGEYVDISRGLFAEYEMSERASSMLRGLNLG